MKRTIFAFTVLFIVAALRTQANGLLSDSDRQIVASCMVLEAGGEGPEGMQAVLNVILNRAKNDLSRVVPITVKRGAFSCMSNIWRIDAPDCSPLIDRAMNQAGAYATASQLIDIMEQGLLLDNTGGATHYHATYMTPYWAASMRYLTTIGGHHFYVEPEHQIAAL